jgi:hypothetical protein
VIGISSPGLGVAARALLLLAQIEIAEARQLDLLAALERGANLLEEGLDDVLGLALIEPELLEQVLGHVCLGQCHYRTFWNQRPDGVAGPAGQGPAERMVHPSAVRGQTSRLGASRAQGLSEGLRRQPGDVQARSSAPTSVFSRGTRSTTAATSSSVSV